MEVDASLRCATLRRIEIRLFDRAADFSTMFRQKEVVLSQPDGSLCLTKLADTLAVSQPSVCNPITV